MERERSEDLPGISGEQIQRLVEIMGYFERIRQASVYGSRVVGGFRPDSDIDIAISVSQPKTFCVSDIQDSLSILILERLGLDPHLKVIEEIHNPDLIYKIKTEGIVVYKRRD